jgi:hypothetical protein
MDVRRGLIVRDRLRGRLVIGRRTSGEPNCGRRPLRRCEHRTVLSEFARSSILVRNYVQARFQLDPNNVGAAALENRPPNGVDRSVWSGVAIVRLKSKR